MKFSRLFQAYIIDGINDLENISLIQDTIM